ncbi:hypothetical protein ACTFIZ_006836 [Dictyostelium cf. discoideum]
MGKDQPKQEFRFGLYQGTVYEAQDLNGKADPFVQVRAIKTDGSYSKVLFKSTVKKATLTPAWNEYDKIKVKDYVNDLLVELYDEDLVKNDFIGRQIINMGRVRSGIFDEIVKFEDDKNKVKVQIELLKLIDDYKSYKQNDKGAYNFVTSSRVVQIRYSNIEIGYQSRNSYERERLNQTYLKYKNGDFDHKNLLQIIETHGPLPPKMIQSIFNKFIIDPNLFCKFANKFFNLSCIIINNDNLTPRLGHDENVVYNLLFLSPDIFLKPNNSYSYDHTYMWSFGCCLYQCLTGISPFNSFEEMADFIKNKNQLTIDIPQKFYKSENQSLISLIKSILCKKEKESDKLTWDQCLKHCFFSDVF